MPTPLYKVKFSMGENATDSNPAIEAGQIVLDTAQGKECVFVDINDSTRLQVKDPTKMDKWGEVNSYGDPYTYIEPSTSIVLGHTTLSGGTLSTIRGLVVDKENDMIAFQYIDGRSDDAYLTQVQQAVHSDGITNEYYNSENGRAIMTIGKSKSANLRVRLETEYNLDNVDYNHGFEISSAHDGFLLGSRSHLVGSTTYNNLMLLVRATHLSIEYDNQISTTKNISFLPDTDTEQFLIHGVCSPKEDIDAANKQYVDQKVSEVQTTWTDW